MDRVALKLEVKNQVKGNRWVLLKPIIIAGVITYVLSWIISSIIPTIMFDSNSSMVVTSSTSGLTIALISVILITSLIPLVVSAPLQMGVNMYYSDYNKENYADINTIFKPFKYTIKIFVTMVFVSVLILVGSLLFIIPGILLSLAFTSISYTYMKHPELGVMDMVSTSWRMMKGHKFEYLVLELSFMGWVILSIFTCGILSFWLTPYYRMTLVRYFEEIDDEYFGSDQVDEPNIDVDVSSEEESTHKGKDNVEESVIDIDLTDDNKTE